MFGFSLRIICGFLLSLALVACGGGGGGGSKPKPSSSSSSSAAPVDTDGDGRPDVSDTFPNDPKEWVDTDKDGVGDNADAFPNDATETKDSDGDGVGDNKDAFPNDATETVDTDKDGVGDNADAFPNDATETKDSDGDGVGDNTDAFPNDATETVDTDKDGVGDNADPTPLGQPIANWANYQGSAQHTGWVDVNLVPENFKQRWEASSVGSYGNAVAADGYIFVVSHTNTLQALDARTGAVLWTQTWELSDLTYARPVYADGIVYLLTGDAYRSLQAFTAADGKLLFSTSLEGDAGYNNIPVVVGETVYTGGHSWSPSYAINAKTGAIEWQQMFDNDGYSVPVVVGEYALEYDDSPSGLVAINRQTGNVDYEIPDSQPNWYSWGTVPVASGDYVLVNHWYRVSAFNLASRKFAWEVSDAEINSQPVVKGDRWYIINKGVVEVRSLATGERIASIKGKNAFSGDLIITNNLLFVGDGNSTYAHELEGYAQVWKLNDKAGSMVLAEGALVVMAPNGTVAIDVQEELDADGLPDWWERRFGKNFDPAADADADGLTNLQEFTLGTNPLVADTDGDGLLDGAEVAGGKSSPLQKDTDDDGLDDGQEVNTHQTDPSKRDTDGDGFDDAEELAVGFNPLDGQDALADSDGDGFSNMHELRANTSVSDANSRPQISEWSMRYGNAQRNPYNPLLLNETRFSERWSKVTSTYFTTPVTAPGRLILTSESLNRIVGWDSGTGAEIWSLTANNQNSGNPYASMDAGKVVQKYGNGYKQDLVVTDAITGARLLTKESDYSSYYGNVSPLVSNGRFYEIDFSQRQLKAYKLTDGNLQWSSPLGDQYQAYGYQPLVSKDHVVVVDQNLQVFSANTGVLLKTIDITGLSVHQAVLGTNNNLILTVSADGSRTSIDLTTGNRSWTSSDCAYAQTAVGNGKAYALNNNGELCAIDELTGALIWRAELPKVSINSNLVLTASHLFYSAYSSTYAVNLVSKKVAWQLNKSGSMLALAPDGTLYLAGGAQITAIDTEGDTDGDGLLQWWERRYGGDLDPAADADQDGLTNLQEFAAKTNPLVADTDGDGLSDYVEINTSKTDPLVADTDKDGLSDGVEVNTTLTNPRLIDTDADGLDDQREYAAGLDGNNKDDAELDNDNDGFSNREEVFSGTDLNNAASKPTAADWLMEQGNRGRTAFQPYRLDEANFALRWEKTFANYIRPITTGNGSVFVTLNNNNASRVLAVDVVNGEQQWQTVVGYAGSPTYNAATNQVVVATNNHPTGLQRLDSTSGAAAPHLPVGLANTEYSPVIVGDIAYSYSGSKLQAISLVDGQILWQTGELGYYGTSQIVVNDQYLFRKQNGQIYAYLRATGALAFSLNTSTTNYGYLVLGSRNNIIDINSDGITSFDLNTRKENWSQPFSYGYSNNYALANGQLYVGNSYNISSINEMTGEMSWRSDSTYFTNNMVATLTHVFVSSSGKTYALSAATGEQVWSYDAGGRLALGADGALYIQSNNQLLAINLEGDRDGDGMPDWWERRYGLNPDDATDAAQDLDNDGLTNLGEFNASSYANNPDSDADGLSDGIEVNTHHTSPTNADSDSDDLADGWEINNSLNPLSASDRDQDLDGDGIPNYEEFREGTDPNNALSLPALFTPNSYSFEDNLFPTGWVLSAETTSVQVISSQASDGTHALQLQYQADISFEGYFMASDLKLDVKNACAYGYGVQIYIDDQLASGDYSPTTQWKTLNATIPLGRHKVSIRSNSSSCAVYLDNLVITPAVSNTQLAVQLVGFDGNLLQFVSIDGEVVRTLAVNTPEQNQQLVGITAAGNDKLILTYQVNDNNSYLRLLDLTTFNWRDFTDIDSVSTSTSGAVVKGNFAYVPSNNSYLGTSSGKVLRINLSSGAIDSFGSHFYTALALDSAGFIYAHSDGVVYKYDPATLALVSQVATIYAQQLLFDSSDKLIVVSSHEVVRYNAQRVIDARITSDPIIQAVALNEKDELFVGLSNKVARYNAAWTAIADWQVPLRDIATFTLLDSDTDGLPDWWELRNGLNPADAADIASDSDNDGLTALEEYELGTNPQLADTDGDSLSDGDEVNTHHTNPLAVDTDGDHLTDAEEINQYSTNPLLVDSDSDGTDDYREHVPALVNFTESFEGSVTRWVTSAGANAGWTVVNDKASNGSRSLRSGAIGHYQTAAVEWYANFNQSTLSFDAWVSSESCCDYLIVYVDDVERLTVTNNNQWQARSLSLNAGFHTVKFVYRKDGSVVSGSDAVWIDNIRVQ